MANLRASPRRGIAVIGSAFGDEGKGLMTDYFAGMAPHKTLVVRFNGGAQAGHTVVRGHRHVFQHYGSGTLAGASTYLGPKFILNPIIWKREQLALRALGVPDYPMYIHESCYITTPYDMMVNQELERARGINRHGSCGRGFYQTIQRYRAGGFPRMRDKRHLMNARDYSATCLKDQGIPVPPEMNDMEIAHRFLDEVDELMGRHATMVDSSHVFPRYDRFVFEGAQGLLLSENNKKFMPYLTPSDTGANNAITIARDIGIEVLDPVYVMRSYMTRHGPGPFPSEVPNQFSNLDDATANWTCKTNEPNEFQGMMRYGALDLNLIAEAVHQDLIRNAAKIDGTPTLAVTHMDKRGVIVQNNLNTMFNGHENFIRAIQDTLAIPVRYTSYGPTAKDVRVISSPADAAAHEEANRRQLENA